MILDGKKVRDEILDNIKTEIASNNLDLTLAILLVGDFPQSKIYVKNKIKACEKVGIKTALVDVIYLPPRTFFFVRWGFLQGTCLPYYSKHKKGRNISGHQSPKMPTFCKNHSIG